MSAHRAADAGERLVTLDSNGPERRDPMMVGAKAAGLMRMSEAGLPVPPGFVVTTQACGAGDATGRGLAPEIVELLDRGMHYLEHATGRRFGSARRPLLVSVRSGAPVSMPGMLETVLDVGLCDTTVSGLIRATGDPVFAWNSYQRLIRSYAEVVEECPTTPFAVAVEDAMTRDGLPDAAELDVSALRSLVRQFHELYGSLSGHPFPQDPSQQLRGAVEAVLRSWHEGRAAEYRHLQGLDWLPGTAVTVQAMVFGNRGATSGAGVGFTRNPATGTNELYVDFLLDAQGEDVVAGRHVADDAESEIAAVPGLADRLESVRGTLETIFSDAQDFEFTVEEGALWLLQTRVAKRTPLAALQIACDLVAEGMITPATALERLGPYDLESIVTVELAPHPGIEPLCPATPASTGVTSGHMALDVEGALERAGRGESVILVRQDASTEDIAALAVSKGLLTASGARTSHAAVVARQLGVVCLVGCADLAIDVQERTISVGSARLAEGDTLTLDAVTGQVYPGSLGLVERRPTELIELVRGWQKMAAGRAPG